MKLIRTALSMALLSAAPIVAHGDVTIYWNTYTATAFDVTISGTGNFFLWGSTTYAGWMGTTTSPNGLWELSTENDFLYPSFGPAGYVNIYNHGSMTYHGTILGINNPNTYTQGYNDFLYFTGGSVHDGAGWNGGDSVYPYNHLWNGYCPIDITSIPDPDDLSTWTWTAQYSGTVVPEPGTASLAVLGALAMTLRRSVAKAGSTDGNRLS